MSTPRDFFDALTGALSSIQQLTGGEVHRGTSPEGKEVFVHLSLEGEITTVDFSGDAVKDLTMLRVLVAPHPSGVAES